MSERRTVRSDDGTHARYRRALEACSRVAADELQVAVAALRDAAALGERLRASVASIVERSGPSGAAIEDARARLREVQARLEGTIASSIGEARQRLAAKRAALDRFTVTLFGRTMAGKSTLREALTRGDGATIGKGAQRTTRDVREYAWSSLRILDTPGIGAYEGDEDRARAVSVLDETDVVLFLASSDGIQDESFQGIQALRQRNKPVVFVLNVKCDLGRPVLLRRFLADPHAVFDAGEIRGHVDRIHRLAGDVLGMTDIRVVPIHAQAAYLATRPEHRSCADRLAAHSRLDDLLAALEGEVVGRGAVRRVQTVIDGNLGALIDLQAELHAQGESVRTAAGYLKAKFGELDVWLDGFVRATPARAAAEAAVLVQPLRAGASAFVDENIERADVAARWQGRVEALEVGAWIDRQQTTILDDLRGRLAEFSREMAVESRLVTALDTVGPRTFDPWDVKRTLRWVSTGSAALASVAVVAASIGGANFWNPVGWVTGALSMVAFALSWMFADREKKLQRHKANAADELRGTIDQLERRISATVEQWFHDHVTDRIVRGIRTDAQELCAGMFEIAGALEDGARGVGEIVERLNRRLLVRTGQLLGSSVSEAQLARVVRAPGIRTKFLWAGARGDAAFCRDVGRALGERIDGIHDGPRGRIVASALRPATVAPFMVSVTGQTALVRIPREQVGRAIGSGGNNVSLASRLIGLRIEVIAEERVHG